MSVCASNFHVGDERAPFISKHKYCEYSYTKNMDLYWTVLLCVSHSHQSSHLSSFWSVFRHIAYRHLFDTSHLQLILWKLLLKKSLDYRNYWVCSQREGNPCLQAVTAASPGVSLYLLKDVLSNINHTSKQWWILKSDQGYCPGVCVLPQTASFYMLSSLLPWDFSKLKACWHHFQDFRSVCARVCLCNSCECEFFTRTQISIEWL